MGKVLTSLYMVLSVAIIVGVGAERAHHVVENDRGWDPNSDVSTWSRGQRFHIGDKIWFTYSAAQENIVELKSKEDFDACDTSNPIRILTDGLDVLPLEKEGIRYFASGKSDSCKNGLKLHVEVRPQPPNPHHKNTEASMSITGSVADGPITPSASSQLNKLSFWFFIGLLVYCAL